LGANLLIFIRHCYTRFFICIHAAFVTQITQELPVKETNTYNPNLLTPSPVGIVRGSPRFPKYQTEMADEIIRMPRKISARALINPEIPDAYPHLRPSELYRLDVRTFRS
jgi:hypothetical protein